MAAGKYDISLEQGATYRDSFTWRQEDGSVPPTGPIIDLTGATARMQIRPTVSDATILLDLTTVNGGLIIHPGLVSPNLEIYITDVQTTGLTFTTAVYDLEVVFPNGDVTRLLKGNVTLDPEVTR